VGRALALLLLLEVEHVQLPMSHSLAREVREVERGDVVVLTWLVRLAHRLGLTRWRKLAFERHHDVVSRDHAEAQ
jgi:hypothetical protein